MNLKNMTAEKLVGLYQNRDLSVTEVIKGVFEEIEPELTRISLRSKNKDVNVSDIAGLFGGGGHPAAAGARIAGRPMSIQRRVVAAIKKAINAAR